MTLFFVLVLAALAVALKKLTPAAGAAGAAVAIALYTGLGYPGLLFLALFFISATWATSWRRREKIPAGQEPERRTTAQVLANGGVAAAAGIGASCFPAYTHACQILAAGSLAAACSDTLSSELGMVYGRRFVNILSWAPDRRGLDGVVSWEGLLAGFGGALVIAVAQAWAGRSVGEGACVLLGGMAGNLLDSYLGATLERKGRLGNNAVNAVNTLAGALVALGLNGI